MKKEDKVFLEHIYESIRHIENHLESFPREKFLKDIKLQDAIIRRLEIIGQATKNLSSELREKHPEVPWKLITGTRDVISHEYFGVDFIMIWNIAKKDIPELKVQILKLLEEI